VVDDPTAREMAEILGVREEGSPGERLEDLFVRFQAQVPYERSGPPRGPGQLLRGFVDAETGGEGEERTDAFLALARSLGHELEVHGAVSPGGGRRVAVSRAGGRLLLVDPGFPFPCLLPLDRPGEEIPTGYGKVRPEADGAGYRVIIETRGKSVEVARFGAGPRDLPTRRPSAPSPPGRLGQRARFRLLDDSLLRWRAGRMEVTDYWSRLTHPLGGGEKEILEALFRVPCNDLAEIPPDGAPVALAVYDFVPLQKDRLESRLACRPGPTDGGLPGAAEGSPITSRRWDFAELAGGTRVKLTAEMVPVPPRGPTETLRKTLVFLLVSEILDLSRD
jgi:hypothetical protein